MQPLRFEPLLKDYLWGGRRLGTLLGKSIGDRDSVAESWELVDRPNDQSVVADGPWRGETLHGLLQSHGREVLGRHASAILASGASSSFHPATGSSAAPIAQRDRFPLLLKFLDAHRVLSVQVHPDDAYGSTMSPPDLGKTEAWYVVHAAEGAKIYAGLKEGVDRDALARAIADGTTPSVLHVIEAKTGDCLFIPSGTVHALGEGLVICEIQQNSDTTFRLFDWNRLDASGKPRALHVDASLAVTDYARGPLRPQVAQPTDDPGRRRLVECEKFVVDRLAYPGGTVGVGGDDRFHLLATVAGQAGLQSDAGQWGMPLGQSILVPASTTATLMLTPGSVVLDMYLP
jgi:mannose-6-phosphate isomerase